MTSKVDPCTGRVNQQTQSKSICITCVRHRPNVFDVGPTLYKFYTNVLFLLGEFIIELGPKASCGWGKGRTRKYYKLFNYKGVSFWLIRMAYSLITACPYMRIKSVILIKLWCFTVDRNSRHAMATTVTERGMLCAYFIYIKTDINR